MESWLYESHDLFVHKVRKLALLRSSDATQLTFKQSLILVTLYTLYFHSHLTKLELFFLFSLISGVTSEFFTLLKQNDLSSYCHMWHKDFVKKGPLWSSFSLLKGHWSRSHSWDGRIQHLQGFPATKRTCAEPHDIFTFTLAHSNETFWQLSPELLFHICLIRQTNEMQACF